MSRTRFPWHEEPVRLDSGDLDWHLDGPIVVGEEFIWEPTLAHAVAHLRVIAMHGEDSEHEIVTEVLRSMGPLPVSATGPEPEPTWNDESRFREACVRRDPSMTLAGQLLHLARWRS